MRVSLKVCVGLVDVVEVTKDWCIVFGDVFLVRVCGAEESCGNAIAYSNKLWWKPCGLGDEVGECDGVGGARKAGVR